MITDIDLQHLRRCVQLAAEALAAGDEPFGSALVAAEGTVLREERNHISSGDRTRHPEFALARWAANHTAPDQRAAATVYTSGEHCPMCAAAHAWTGLGRIVYATSANQLTTWLADLAAPTPPVQPLRIPQIAPGIETDGPVPELADQVHDLHRRYHGSPAGGTRQR